MNDFFLNRFFGTFFYVEMTPIVPGTVASLIASIFTLIICYQIVTI